MAARQQTDFSPAAGGLFLQLDILSQHEAQDEIRLHTLEVEGYNPNWAEPVIRRNYLHQHISERPTLRLALHGLRQSLEDLGNIKSQEFAGAHDWFNEVDCPMKFSWVCTIFEINPCHTRTAIHAIRAGVFTIAGSRDLLRLRSATPSASASSRQRAAEVKIAQDIQAATIASETTIRAKAFARGLEWPFHASWGVSWPAELGGSAQSPKRLQHSTSQQSKPLQPQTVNSPDAINLAAKRW